VSLRVWPDLWRDVGGWGLWCRCRRVEQWNNTKNAFTLKNSSVGRAHWSSADDDDVDNDIPYILASSTMSSSPFVWWWSRFLRCKDGDGDDECFHYLPLPKSFFYWSVRDDDEEGSWKIIQCWDISSRFLASLHLTKNMLLNFAGQCQQPRVRPDTKTSRWRIWDRTMYYF